MDDDREESTGLSGWASFQLGRMAAENDRHTSETLRTVFNRRQTVSEVDALLAQNRAFAAQNQVLAAENLRLRQSLAAYERNYDNLDAWADRAKARIEQLLKDQT